MRVYDSAKNTVRLLGARTGGIDLILILRICDRDNGRFSRICRAMHNYRQLFSVYSNIVSSCKCKCQRAEVKKGVHSITAAIARC